MNPRQRVCCTGIIPTITPRGQIRLWLIPRSCTRASKILFLADLCPKIDCFQAHPSGDHGGWPGGLRAVSRVHALVVAPDFGEVGVLCLTAPLGRAAPVTGQRVFEHGHFVGEFTFPRAGLYTLFVNFIPSAMAHGSAADHTLHHRRRLSAMEGMAHNRMVGHSMRGMDHSTHMDHPEIDRGALQDHAHRPPSPLVNPMPFARTIQLQLNVTERMAVGIDGMPLAPDPARHSRHKVQSQFPPSRSPLVPWPAMYEGMDDEDGGGFNRTRPAPMDGDAGSEGIAELKANNGFPVFAGGCTPLELTFKMQSGGLFKDLEAFMGAAARVVVAPRGSELSVAYYANALPTVERGVADPRDFDENPEMVMELQDEPAGLFDTVMQNHDLCDIHHQLHTRNDNAGFFGPKLLAHVVFNQTGPHVVIVQAFRQRHLLIGRCAADSPPPTPPRL